jgi:signal transduction histidine kinase
METFERLEIRYWVQNAIALYESDGEDEVLRQIADPDGRFIQKELYIFALDTKGTLLAHPFSTTLVGANLLDYRDCNGKPFIRKIIATAKNRGYGFADYSWRLPNSEEDLNKTVFFERVHRIVLCSGFYKKDSPFEGL